MISPSASPSSSATRSAANRQRLFTGSAAPTAVCTACTTCWHAHCRCEYSAPHCRCEYSTVVGARARPSRVVHASTGGRSARLALADAKDGRRNCRALHCARSCMRCGSARLPAPPPSVPTPIAPLRQPRCALRQRTSLQRRLHRPPLVHRARRPPPQIALKSPLAHRCAAKRSPRRPGRGRCLALARSDAVAARRRRCARRPGGGRVARARRRRGEARAEGRRAGGGARRSASRPPAHALVHDCGRGGGGVRGERPARRRGAALGVGLRPARREGRVPRECGASARRSGARGIRRSAGSPVLRGGRAEGRQGWRGAVEYSHARMGDEARPSPLDQTNTTQSTESTESTQCTESTESTESECRGAPICPRGSDSLH
jgi:hypothetical protein